MAESAENTELTAYALWELLDDEVSRGILRPDQGALRISFTTELEGEIELKVVNFDKEVLKDGDTETFWLMSEEAE